MTTTVDFTDPLVIAVSRRIDAPAHRIFAILRDPQRHYEIDGSTMIRGSDAPFIIATGDAFVTRMHNDMFGDYEMRNEVVDYVADSHIAWAPKRHDIVEESWNHRWGWHLVDDGDATDVTAYLDCTRVPEKGLREIDNGEWGRPILEESLTRLARAVVDTGES